jgi:hypothetical protein
MRKSRQLIAVLVLMALSACAGIDLDTAWDAHYDFSGLRTYDWAPTEPETGPDLPYDIIDRAIKRAVEAEMSARGFTLQPSNPSFRLAYYVGVEEVTRITNSAYYGPGWGASWGYGWFGPAGVNVSQYDEGTITLDVLSSDPSVGLVWRGIASTQLGTAMSPQQIEGAIPSAVRALLEDFPPELER